MAYIPDKIQLQDTVYKMVQKVNSGLEQLRKTDDTTEELRVTVSDIQTLLSNLQTSVFDSIDDAIATSKSYTDTKTAETYNESKAYTDQQIQHSFTSHLEDHLKILISIEPPERPNNKTFWLQDLGESINLTSGGGGLLIGNASIDGSSDVWFDKNI